MTISQVTIIKFFPCRLIDRTPEEYAEERWGIEMPNDKR